MYSYTYDPKTGGLLLNSTPTEFSREPRPVYATELDLLGFDKYWKYDGQTESPYMWAEANSYWYKGKLVARLKGGNLYTAPEIIIPREEDGRPVLPENDGSPLRKVDLPAMVEANREMLGIIEQATVKKILSIYMKYKDKLDCFHVAFSGGKDSCVLLDLVKKALPKGSFVVVFGDTGMEFPDTYDVIEETHLQCINDGIPFYIAKSHLEPEQTWQLFGPPSRTLRWCCFVHKSAPQTLKLREITGKSDFVGLDFVGVRAHESMARSDYEYENYGKKQKGQYSHNSILEWTSGEVWLYMYANNILINETYKKGNARAGCLLCPMSGNLSNFFRQRNYNVEVDKYVEFIKQKYDYDHEKNKDFDSYLLNGGWNARKNGRELTLNQIRCIEKTVNGRLVIEIIDPESEWSEWIKTLGMITENNGKKMLEFKGTNIEFQIKNTNRGYVASISEEITKRVPVLGRLFRQVFRKAAYCNACRVCEINCKHGCISFLNEKIVIKDCVRCHDCHAIDGGCILFHSLRHPQGGGKSMKSLNSFADHAPKYDWLRSYFELKNTFFSEHTLGPMMYDMFRRFLRDAFLNEKNTFTPFAELVSDIGWQTDISWGLILINLVDRNPQIEWYVKKLKIGNFYSRRNVEDDLIALDVKPKDARSIVKSFKRLIETPLGTSLRFGYVTDEGDLVRTKCTVSDPRVILYGLYKFAEKCNDYKDFTLATLLSDGIERDGISPTLIFGLGRDEMIPMLLGLSAKYPEFITASFTHDLERITLKDDKTSAQVLDLFRGGTMYE